MTSVSKARGSEVNGRFGVVGVVLAGKKLKPKEEHVVVVDGGVIDAIVPTREAGDIAMVRVPDAVIMPGVINCHVHRVHSPGDRRDRFLRHGVTSVGDAAAPLAALDMLRRSPPGETATAGFTGPMLCPPGGYPLPVHSPDHALVIHSPEQGREKVCMLADLGVTAIKCAFEPGPYAEPWPLFDAVTAGAIGDEARRRGLLVRCHVEDFGGLETALNAGVHTIEHVPHRWIRNGRPHELITEGRLIRPYQRLLERMVRDDIILTPTLDVLSRSIWNGPELYEPVRHFHKIGGHVAVGNDHPYRRTDAGMPMREFDLFAKVGLGNQAILVAATRNSGTACGFTGRGWLGRGMAADMLVLSGNPREDLSHLDAPVLVIKDGVVIS